MEGKVGNIFESQFPHTVVNNRYSNPAVQTSSNNIPSNKTIKEKSREHVNHALRNSSIAVGIGVTLLAPIVILATKGKLPKPITSFIARKLFNMTIFYNFFTFHLNIKYVYDYYALFHA